MPPRLNPNPDYSNQSSSLKSLAQPPICPVATNASIKGEAKLLKKLKSKAPHYNWSKPISLSLNLSVSLVISDKRLEEKLSHNAHSIIGKSSVAILVRKKAKPRPFALPSEQEKVSMSTCLSLISSTTSYDLNYSSFWK